MEKAKYIFERISPYFIALIITLILVNKNINFVTDNNLNDALNGVNTMCALIIGFLGAVLPVILGMKNESKFVKYVFEKDTKKLFLKYIKSAMLMGLITVAITILMYFRGSFKCDKTAYYLFYLWVYMVLLFLLTTYRCLSNMLELIFSDDSKLKVNPNSEFSHEDKSDKEIHLEEKYKKNF